MATQSPDNLQKLISQFSPLNQVDQKYQAKLEKTLRVVRYSAGEPIVKKSRNSKLQHFLVSGKVELRAPFDERSEISSYDERCSQSLEYNAPGEATVRALSDCEVLLANTDKIDQLLTWSQDFNMFYLEKESSAPTMSTPIEDNIQEDWDNMFIRSPLAANLSNTAIHQFFSSLEEVAVKADEIIIKCNTPGDYFYIIKSGHAVVETNPNGPYEGDSFPLNAGNYFGDEALVADTIRNATIRMKTDGVLGRLNKTTFEEIIKEQLVSPVTRGIPMEGDNVKILDVRFPAEFRIKHYKNSKNLPITDLRKVTTHPLAINFPR